MSSLQPDDRALGAELPKKFAVLPGAVPIDTQGTNIGDLPTPAAEAQSAPVDMKAQLDFLWNTHKYLNDYIRFADTKRRFTVALVSTVVGDLFAGKLHDLFLLTAPKQWTVIAWLSAGAFFALGASIACGVWTIRPRLLSKQSKGFLYWGGVTEHRSPEAFWNELRRQSQERLAEHLGHHVFCLSELSRKKYFWVSLSMSCGGFGGFGGLLASLVLLFK